MHTARPRSHTRQGFALVELFVVITIVAILFAVTVLAVDAVSGTGKTRTCADDTQTLRAAVEAYRAKHAAPLVTPTEHQLVNAGLLNNVSSQNDLLYSGDGALKVTRVAYC